MAARSPVACAALFVTLLGAGAGPVAAEPASAQDALRRHLDGVFATLQSRPFLAKDGEARREAVRRLGDRLFDWDEMARRALGPHWNARTPAERRAFAAHFARVAERSYLWQVERMRAEHVIDRPVRYLGETPQGRETVVHTKLEYLRDLPADFRMRHRAGRWEVCDVVIDGVSVTANYRAQFDRLIARGSYPALVDRMTGRGAVTADDGAVVPSR